MKTGQSTIKAEIILPPADNNDIEQENGKKYLRRIAFSGVISLILIIVIIYSMPRTILTTSSLIEYSTIVALIIFLFVLLFRYFAILVLAYFYINEYTYKSGSGFYPFLSIIIPVYNEEKVVADSVSSLLALDYSNYEIIIVNDGSTDKTKNVAEK